MITTARKPLRLWPGVVIVIVQWLMRFVLPRVMPEELTKGVIGGMICGLAVLLWWLFFSRAPWFDRLGAVVLMIASYFATSHLIHISIKEGAQGLLFPILAIPVVSLALVAWALTTSRLSDGIRRVTMVATIVIACGGWALVKTGGFTGSFQNDLQWRWAKTPEERLLARSDNESVAIPPAQSPAKIPEKQVMPKSETKPAAPPSTSAGAISFGAETSAVWPGFRGPHRDDVIPGVAIKTDWTTSPPVALWRRSVGPGWSSFAVQGDLVYTLEQRGPDEVVACYKLSTGKPVWIHRDAARFWESNAGPGPRGTPTLSNGHVHTFGATGVLNALNASDGTVVWSHNGVSGPDTKIPTWGFASSPLVINDSVIVGVAGQLVAYDLVTGARRWAGPPRGVSYSSPHLVTIDGVDQVLQLSEAGVTSVAPADGTLLWEHAWKGYPIVQPALTGDGDILISISESSGTRRIALARGPDGWSVQERWTSNALKPYFNDFVVHNGYAFGFDGSILACVDLKDGTRKWKGGRYGNGQLVLLRDQELLLVLSEQGELVLVPATPDQFTELARFQAIEGKTWNHPVLAGDILLVRNGEEMAAFRLPLAGR